MEDLFSVPDALEAGSFVWIIARGHIHSFTPLQGM